MEHIKMFWSRVNIPQLLGCCQENELWTEAVFLYRHYDQYDQAVQTLMEHSPECWSHELFKECLKKVANTEIYYQAIDFYLTEQPLLLNDLLMDMTLQLDHARVVNKVTQCGHLPLIEKYLLHVQHDNIVEVNEKVNQLFVDMEDYKSLRKSITTYSSFDQTQLALQLEKHELFEFRRIAAYLYKVNKRWDKSTELSKRDKIWQDAMETTAASGNAEQSESLLRFFVEENEPACFAACLFICYEHIKPDVVLELAWRHNLYKWAMPYFVQAFSQVTVSLNEIIQRQNAVAEEQKAADKKEKDKEAERQNTEAAFVGTGTSYSTDLPLGLPAPMPGQMPGQMAPQMGFPNQMQQFPQNNMGFPSPMQYNQNIGFPPR
eukprot:TRINITY_DN259_c1_g1_i1.p1 TRINITY_DN259_c1_g1~~TRINITY_DN259_c1_g1_i1.p1  ORF type:complete len:388 (-),score=80.99 TRINITY_DN259_c1_g1_i1:225-1352(-)